MNPLGDNQIKTRTKCQIDNCTNQALVYINDIFICGQCTVKFNAAHKKYILEQMQHI